MDSSLATEESIRGRPNDEESRDRNNSVINREGNGGRKQRLNGFISLINFKQNFLSHSVDRYLISPRNP